MPQYGKQPSKNGGRLLRPRNERLRLKPDIAGFPGCVDLHAQEGAFQCDLIRLDGHLAHQLFINRYRFKCRQDGAGARINLRFGVFHPFLLNEQAAHEFTAGDFADQDVHIDDLSLTQVDPVPNDHA